MAMSEVIEQLKSLIDNSKSFVDEKEPDSVWNKDVEALNVAIEKLRGERVGDDPAATVKQLIEREGTNQTELAEKMGVVRQNVSQMLNRNKVSMSYKGFSRMVDALGYEIIVRKK